jgi:hypothetical protein
MAHETTATSSFRRNPTKNSNGTQNTGKYGYADESGGRICPLTQLKWHLQQKKSVLWHS